MRWLLVLLVSVANAEEWKPADKWLFGTAVGLLVVDWGQSRTIAKEEREFYTTPACADPATRRFAEPCHLQRERVYQEINPLLPRHPSVQEVDRYFALAIGGTVAAAFLLPQRPRRWVLGVIVVLETAVVIRNHQLGIRMAF